MSDECMVFKNRFNKNNNIPFMLSCGDTLYSYCINFYSQAYIKEEFKCPNFCNMTKSLKIENKHLLFQILIKFLLQVNLMLR